MENLKNYFTELHYVSNSSVFKKSAFRHALDK